MLSLGMSPEHIPDFDEQPRILDTVRSDDDPNRVYLDMCGARGDDLVHTLATMFPDPTDYRQRIEQTLAAALDATAGIKEGSMPLPDPVGSFTDQAFAYREVRFGPKATSTDVWAVLDQTYNGDQKLEAYEVLLRQMVDAGRFIRMQIPGVILEGTTPLTEAQLAADREMFAGQLDHLRDVPDTLEQIAETAKDTNVIDEMRPAGRSFHPMPKDPDAYIYSPEEDAAYLQLVLNDLPSEKRGAIEAQLQSAAALTPAEQKDGHKLSAGHENEELRSHIRSIGPFDIYPGATEQEIRDYFACGPKSRWETRSDAERQRDRHIVDFYRNLHVLDLVYRSDLPDDERLFGVYDTSTDTIQEVDPFKLYVGLSGIPEDPLASDSWRRKFPDFDFDEGLLYEMQAESQGRMAGGIWDPGERISLVSEAWRSRYPHINFDQAMLDMLKAEAQERIEVRQRLLGLISRRRIPSVPLGQLQLTAPG